MASCGGKALNFLTSDYLAIRPLFDRKKTGKGGAHKNARQIINSRRCPTVKWEMKQPSATYRIDEEQRWKRGQGVQNVQQQLQQYDVIDFRLAKKLSKYLDLLCVVKEVHVPPSNTRKMSAFFMKVHTRLLQYLGQSIVALANLEGKKAATCLNDVRGIYILSCQRQLAIHV